MKKFPLILDVETKYSFRDFKDPKKLQVTVVATYDYKTNQSYVFEEKELSRLFNLFENSSYLIGFNIIDFDLPVLSAYYPGNIEIFSKFDILDDIKNKIGRRISLNEVINATLSKKKSGHGLMAIDYYRQGKIEELKKYCLDDVMLTKELFDFGVNNGKIYYPDVNGKREVVVDWKKYRENDGADNDLPLTLPF